MARLLQLFAEVRGPAILPHDRVVYRLAAGTVPDHRGFALVGNTDRRDVAILSTRFVQGFAHYR